MSQTPIYTIGYGRREIDEFIAVLQAQGIQYLLDVRSRPYSRYKPDFSKKQLASHLAENNIRYVFMGDSLGGQPEGSEYYNEDEEVDYNKIRSSSFYVAGIARIQEAYRKQLPVVLMCSEGKPEKCHRSRLIGETLASIGIKIAHIDENDQLISQQDANRRRTGGQLPLFGEIMKPQTSLKKYKKRIEPDE